jgi:hypothetical protein
MCRSWQLTDVTFWEADFRFDLVGFDIGAVARPHRPMGAGAADHALGCV